jgi:hypothetical protein
MNFFQLGASCQPLLGDGPTRKHPEIYQSLLTLIAGRLRETDATVAAIVFCRCAAASSNAGARWRRH